jgi:hypothetical protein
MVQKISKKHTKLRKRQTRKQNRLLGGDITKPFATANALNLRGMNAISSTNGTIKSDRSMLSTATPVEYPKYVSAIKELYDTVYKFFKNPPYLALKVSKTGCTNKLIEGTNKSIEVCCKGPELINANFPWVFTPFEMGSFITESYSPELSMDLIYKGNQLQITHDAFDVFVNLFRDNMGLILKHKLINKWLSYNYANSKCIHTSLNDNSEFLKVMQNLQRIQLPLIEINKQYVKAHDSGDKFIKEMQAKLKIILNYVEFYNGALDKIYNLGVANANLFPGVSDNTKYMLDIDALKNGCLYIDWFIETYWGDTIKKKIESMDTNTKQNNNDPMVQVGLKTKYDLPWMVDTELSKFNAWLEKHLHKPIYFELENDKYLPLSSPPENPENYKQITSNNIGINQPIPKNIYAATINNKNIPIEKRKNDLKNALTSLNTSIGYSEHNKAVLNRLKQNLDPTKFSLDGITVSSSNTNKKNNKPKKFFNRVVGFFTRKRKIPNGNSTV